MNAQPFCFSFDFLRFLVSVPSLPPTDVSGYNTSSSTIRISWKAIPTAYRHGIMRGYYIEYSLKGSGIWEELIVCPNQLSANITELSAYREYEIMISGFTFKGNGSVSESVFIWTDQDSKSRHDLYIDVGGI